MLSEHLLGKKDTFIQKHVYICHPNAIRIIYFIGILTRLFYGKKIDAFDDLPDDRYRSGKRTDF